MGKRFLAALMLISLGSCGQHPEEFYVSAPDGAAIKLVKDLAKITDDQGMKVNLGSATDDQGNTLRVAEAHRLGIHVWAQNMPRSPEEASACGESHLEVYPDPREFVVRVESGFPFIRSQLTLSQTARTIQHQLGAMGYAVTSAPSRC